MNKKIKIIASSCVIDNNKILMVQENKDDIKGLWNLPGGKVKICEDVEQATKREVFKFKGGEITTYLENYDDYK